MAQGWRVVIMLPSFTPRLATHTDAEGRAERHFVAQFEAPQIAIAPNDLMPAGEVYWTRDEERRRK